MLHLMKKHISLLLAIAMILGTVCVPRVFPLTSAAETPANTSSEHKVIFEDDFEDTKIQSARPTGWTGTTDSYVTYTLEENVEGMTGKALKQVKTGASTRSLYVDIRNYPVVAGKTYRAELDVYVVPDNTDTTIAKSFQFYLQSYTAGHAVKVDTQNIGHEAIVEEEVMHDAQTLTQHFLGLEKVADIGTGIATADGTFTRGIDGQGIALVAVIVEIDDARMGHEMAVTGVAAGHDAIEKIHAAPHGLDDIFASAHTHQIADLIRRGIGLDGLDDLVHHVGTFPDR